MYKRISVKSHRIIKIHSFTLMICLASLSGSVLAEPALMKPVEDIQFQELPPPWMSEPAPVIKAQPSKVEKKSKPVSKPTLGKLSVKKPSKPVMQSRNVPKPVTPVVKKVATPVVPPAKLSLQSVIAAANGGDAQAQYDLGMRYQYGNGVAKNRSKAHRWLSKSAQSGNSRAQYALSMFYQQFARNQQGVKKALLWMKKAADQGLADAQYSLGMMFKNGSLVHSNPAESRKWLQQAASQGHQLAQLAMQ